MSTSAAKHTLYTLLCWLGMATQPHAAETAHGSTPTCGSPTIKLQATDSKIKFDAVEVFAELKKDGAYDLGTNYAQVERLTAETYTYTYGEKTKSFRFRLLSADGLQAAECSAKVEVRADYLECPSFDNRSLNFADGFCQETKLKNAIHNELRRLIIDQRINYDMTEIDWSNTSFSSHDEFLDCKLAFNVYDLEFNPHTCTADLKVVDTSTPICPKDTVKIHASLRANCQLKGIDAIELFNSFPASVKGKTKCDGKGTLYSNIELYQKDASTHYIGIDENLVYTLDWNKNPSPANYRLAANANYINYTECPAMVIVVDGEDPICTQAETIKLRTETDGLARLTENEIQLLPTVTSCSPIAIRSLYAYSKDGDSGESLTLDLEDFHPLPLTPGAYTITGTFERGETSTQTHSKVTCPQTLIVEDGTKPNCPALRELDYSNRVCLLGQAHLADTLKQMVKATLVELDNATSNSNLAIAILPGEDEVKATAEKQALPYTYKITDEAGNSALCPLTITLCDNTKPICQNGKPDTLRVDKGQFAKKTYTLTGTDMCGISEIGWALNNNSLQSETGEEVKVCLENLAAGTHTLMWTLTDGSGNTSSACTQPVTVIEKAGKDTFATACNSFAWHGKELTQSGDYTNTPTDTTGNDPVVTLHLTIIHSVVKTDTATACDSYTWNGTELTQSGVYADTLTNAAGCDSVNILHLTINSSTRTIDTITACGFLTWNDTTFFTSGTHTDTLASASGCDSIATLHIIINKPATTRLEATACDSFQWQGRLLEESGTYTDTLTTTNGCDSIVELTLTIGHTAVTTCYDTIAAGNAYSGYGFSISQNVIPYIGDYSFDRTTTSHTKCDSTIVLKLRVNAPASNPPANTVPDSTAEMQLGLYCPGDEVTIEDEPGEWTHYTIIFGEREAAIGFLSSAGTTSAGRPHFTVPQDAPAGNYHALLTLLADSAQSKKTDLAFGTKLSNKLIVRLWNDVVLCDNAGNSFTAYQWYKDGSLIEGATNQYYQDPALAKGTYSLDVWTLEEDKHSVCPKTFLGQEPPFSFSVTPNPAKAGEPLALVISGMSKEELENATLFVFDANGILALTKKGPDNVVKTTLEKPGVYTLKLNTGGGSVATRKLVVNP